MADYLNLMRLARVIEIISYTPRTREYICRTLREEGYEFDENRTFDRIIKSIRDIPVNVIYDREKGYSISERLKDYPVLQTIWSLNSVWSAKRHLDRLTQNRRDEVIRTDIYSRGIELIPEMLAAVIHRHMLQFDHFKYRRSSPDTRQVYPLALLESDYQWYLIAWTGIETEPNDPSCGVRSFGLDRISNLQTLENFDRDVPTAVREKVRTYEFRMGVGPEFFSTRPDQEITVTLLVSKSAVNYLRARPIHHSQLITSKVVNDETIVRLTIIPSSDLLKKVASYLGQIKIAGPEELNAYIKKNYPELARGILSNDKRYNPKVD